MPKFTVTFRCRFVPGCAAYRDKPEEMERTENLYAADAAEAEQKARAWWNSTTFHKAVPHKAQPKAEPRKPVTKKQLKEAEF